MRDLTQRLGGRGRAARSSDPAVSAFLYLGEQLERRLGAEASADARIPEEATRTLLEAIEGDIIPRLLLAHRERESGPAAGPDGGASLRSEDHERFLGLVMHDTAASTRHFVAEMLARGVPQESIFLDLLASAARRLGELWEEDRCSFSDVTIGLCRLHEVLREHSSVHQLARPAGDDGPRILLATACADQHVFGVVLVAEFFRRDGWLVWSEPGAVRGQLAAILADVSFDVLGLSASHSAIADEVGTEIATLRKASCNRGLRVLVGGHLFLDTPELADRVGADGSAADARVAPETARRLLAQARAHPTA